MEFIEWAHQLKSHLNLSLHHLQSQTISLSVIIFVLYLISYALQNKASRGYSLLAFLMCIVISYTPLYDILTNTQYYGLFAIIYLRLTYEIKPITAKFAALLMGLFQLTMIVDRIQNAGIETAIYANYEITVCLLHTIIIGNFIKSDIIRIERGIRRIVRCSVDFIRNTSNYAYLW